MNAHTGQNLFRLLFIFFAFLSLSACELGSSDSGADQVPNTDPGDSIPSEFVGVYVGTLNAEVEANSINVTESYSFPITITVSADGMIRFDGDEPDETFTVGVANDGTFSGNLRVEDDDVQGTLGVSGRVDGSTAQGDVTGEGEVDTGLVTVGVTVRGNFSATKQ